MLEEFVLELGAKYCNKTHRLDMDPKLDSTKNWIRIRIQWTFFQNPPAPTLKAVLEEIVLQLGAKYCNKTLAWIRFQSWIHKKTGSESRISGHGSKRHWFKKLS